MSFIPGMRCRSARTIVFAGGIVRRTALGTLVSQRENLGRTLFTVDFDSGQRLILFAHEIEPIALDGIRSNEPESVARLGCEGRAMRGRVVTFRPAARIAMQPRRLPSGRAPGVVLRTDERRRRPARRRWFLTGFVHP